MKQQCYVINNVFHFPVFFRECSVPIVHEKGMNDGLDLDIL